MSRRAAVALASTVVLALLASMLAVTVRLDALRVAADDPPGPRVNDLPSRPIFREVTETITVHRTRTERPDGPAPVVTVVRTTVPAPAPEEEGTDGPPADSGDQEGGGDEHGGGPDHDDEDLPGDKF